MMGLGLINTQDMLIDLCAHLDGQDWVALDTEFIREKTYYPKLCLVQIGVPGRTACIDPLKVDGLNPVLDILYNPIESRCDAEVKPLYQELDLTPLLRKLEHSSLDFRIGFYTSKIGSEIKIMEMELYTETL